MPNGQQLGKENVAAFEHWVALRREAGDWNNYIRAGVLNRSEIALECDFDRKAFRTNGVLGRKLERLEDELRSDGLLPAALASRPEMAAPVQPAPTAYEDTKAVSELRRQVARLQLANAEKDERIRQLEESLRKRELFDLHLRESHRLIRS